MAELFSNILFPALKMIFYILPFMLPPLTAIIFFNTWIRYLRTDYLSKQEYVLLEIKISRDILKSPMAMELFLISLYQTGSVTYTDTYWEGKMKPWFSLEIVSIEGQVRFYIWSLARYKNMIEAQIYAQYPNVEIYEAEDYSLPVKHDPTKVSMWGTYYKLSQKDVYPIKSYIDYGLDKPTKEEEEKIDPFTSVLEYLGSMKAGEQVWIQILIQAHKKEGLREGRLLKKEDWKKAAKSEVEKIRKDSVLKTEGSSFGFPNPTKGQQEQIEAIERSASKYAFDTMMRGIYIAKNEVFKPVSIVGLIGSVRQYGSNNLNGLKLGWYTDHTDNAKDWINIFSWIPGLLKYKENQRADMERQMLEAYKMRSFFQPPYRLFNADPFIMTTEEIATIYHFPGQVATTPTLQRITSRKSKPPSNLPM